MSTSYEFIIPFAVVSPENNPNISLDQEGQVAAYYRAAVTCFASIRRFDSESKLTFLSNAQVPSKYQTIFTRIDVECREVQFLHSPPPGFSATFQGSLFLLDSLRYLQSDISVIIDPDVIFFRDCKEDIDNHTAIGVLEMKYSSRRKVNGLSRRDQGDLHRLLGGANDIPKHFGGEFYVIPQSLVEDVLSRTKKAWDFSIERSVGGLTHFNTEEHVLNWTFSGLPLYSLESVTRRVWTAHSYRNTKRNDFSLSAWHLPAEKARGFDTLYSFFMRDSALFLTESTPDFVQRVAKAMGIRSRTPKRLFFDLVGPIARYRRIIASQISRVAQDR